MKRPHRPTPLLRLSLTALTTAALCACASGGGNGLRLAAQPGSWQFMPANDTRLQVSTSLPASSSAASVQGHSYSLCGADPRRSPCRLVVPGEE